MELGVKAWELDDFFPGCKEIEPKLIVKKARLKRLKGTPKNVKCPGVTRKVAREVRNLTKPWLN